MPLKTFEKFVEENDGDHEAAAKAVYAQLQKFDTDNFSLRDKRRELEGQVKDLSDRVVAEGHVAVTQDDADLLTRYKGLGSYEDVSKQRGELHQLQRGAMLTQVATIAGFRPNILTQLDKMNGELEYKIEDGEDGKTVSVKQGGKYQPLTAYAESEWAEWLPSLNARPGVEQEGGDGSKGTRWPRQGSGNSGGETTVDDVKTHKRQSHRPMI